MQKDSLAKKTSIILLSLFTAFIVGAVVFLLPDKDNSIERSGEGGYQFLDEQAKRTKKIVAVGGIRCDNSATICKTDEVAAIVKRINPEAILLLGDDSSLAEDAPYESNFSEAWRPFLERIYPVTAHKSSTAQEQKKYQDFYAKYNKKVGETGKNYYDFDISKWSIFALDSEACAISSCDRGSEQARWLEEKLAINKSICTIAFWHSPQFGAKAQGRTEDTSDKKAFWELLSSYGADIVLNGHGGFYERLQPISETAVVYEQGPIQFIVGTGGARFDIATDVQKNIQAVLHQNVAGVLELTLDQASYQWKFISTENEVLDIGRANCRDKQLQKS
jgi:acid phosphatase type 7